MSDKSVLGSLKAIWGLDMHAVSINPGIHVDWMGLIKVGDVSRQNKPFVEDGNIDTGTTHDPAYIGTLVPPLIIVE